MDNRRRFFFMILFIILIGFVSNCSGKSRKNNTNDTSVSQTENSQDQQSDKQAESSAIKKNSLQEEAWKETFAFVRDEISFEPSPSVLKTREGVIWGQSGNAIEQALLLAELLREGGEQVRLAFGELNKTDALLLISTMFPGTKEFSYDKEVLLSNPLKDESLINTVRNHCWIQVLSNGQWIDLDPCFPDAEAGRHYASIDRTSENISESSLPNLTISLEVEKGKYSEDGVQKSETNTIWEWKAPLHESLNRAVALKIAANFRAIEGEEKKDEESRSPMGGVMGGLTGGSKKKDETKTKDVEAVYNAILLVDNEEKQEGQFSQLIHASKEKQKETDSITKIQLRFKIDNLGTNPIEADRILFEKQAWEQNPHYFQRHSILITGNAIPTEVWEQDMQRVVELKQLDALKENLAKIKSQLENKKELKSVYETCISLEDKIGSQAGHFINLIFASTSDSLCRNFAQSISVFSYYAKPRILINSFEGTGDEQYVCMDLRLNSREAIPFPGQAAAMRGTFLYGRGVMESTLEGKVIELLTKNRPLTTAYLMQQAVDRDIPIRMYSRLEKDSLEEIPIPSRVFLKAKRVIDSDHILIIPTESIEIDGENRWGWWDMDPQNGEVIGVLDTGLHQAVLQRTILDTSGMLNDDMGLVIGAIVGCVDTHWVLFALILEYGELDKAALQEAKDYMKKIGSYLCPEFEATAGIGVGVSVELEDCWKEEIGVGFHGGLKIDQGWCAKFAKGFKCASTSILNFYIYAAEQKEK